MDQRRPMVLAALVALAAVCGLMDAAWAQSGTATQQEEEARQLQDVVKGFLKDLGAVEGQRPQKGGELEKLLQDISNAAGRKTQGRAGDCLSALLLQNGGKHKAARPEEQARLDALEQYISQALQGVQSNDWTNVIDLTWQALRLEREIKEWALTYSRETYRGQMRSMRGSAYQSLLQGERAKNLEVAIEEHGKALEEADRSPPHEAACARELRVVTQTNLGAAYGQRIHGDQADNLEKAIGAYEATLTELTSDDFPQQWAAAQNNLGAAYLNRIRGKRAQNIEKAIDAYSQALTVWTREAFPAAWATVRSNLGVAYSRRIQGDRADNMERALEAYRDSLSVRTREMPSGEKSTGQDPLGGLSTGGMKAEDPLGLSEVLTNLGKVAAVLGKAGGGPMIVLRPDGWAQSQNNLGVAYFKRVSGDRADNIEQAIGAYQAALQQWTRAAFPAEWAMAQSNLGESYASRITGERAANIAQATVAYREALTIRTRQAFPRDNLETALGLGQALAVNRDWRGALDAFEMARASFRVLFGQGLNEAEARDLLEKAGPLFTEAAYAAAELGDAEHALTLLEGGRARLLAVALKLESLSLSKEKRQRLDKLRLEIRETEAAYEAARGEGKSAKIAVLGSLREQLLQLVDGAEARTKSGTDRDILVRAGAVVPEGGALVAPIVAEAGGKLILVTRNQSGARLAIVDLPGFTRARLDEILGARNRGGWLGAYAINYLAPDEQVLRHGEWLDAIEKVGPKLWALLGQRLADAISSQGVVPGAPLTILPVGPLGLLPLGLAQDPATRRYLMQDYTIAFAPSLAALASAKARAAASADEPSLAAIVNPTGDLPFTALEGALVESRFAVGRKLAVTENAATPNSVLAALKGRDYWHFSSHGYFNWDEPRASGLWLTAKAPLTVGDLTDARGLGAPRLAVLSACETGLYDIATTPNEFTGLPAAFLQLGAGGVLATLWPVNDLSTALLIAKFYDLHRGQGLAPAGALGQAQHWLRRASAQDLREYVRAAVVDRRLPAALSQSVETAIRAARRHRRKISGVQEESRSSTHTNRSIDGSVGSPEADPPFGHPYYWGGFTLTGL